jgi:hypothetical protein
VEHSLLKKMFKMGNLGLNYKGEEGHMPNLSGLGLEIDLYS